MRTLAHVAAALFLLACLPGCPKKGPDNAKKLDADTNSGPDAKRAGATPIEVNKPYTDTVDFDKGDKTDWKSVDLKGRPGPLDVDIHWDNALTDLTIDVFDGIGVQIASSPPNSGESVKHLSVPIQELGTYYIRVQAPKAGATSDYTVEAKWTVEAPPPPPPVEEPAVDKAPKHKDKTPKPPKPAKVRGGSPEGGLQGRIVGAHAEGGGTVLYLDKGAAAGVKEGQNGWILDGPSGFTVLGTLKITKVVDDGRSIAVTSTKIGRNNRIGINTGK